MEFESWTRPEERPFVRRLLDLADRVERQWVPVSTDFLTPREQYIAESVAKGSGFAIQLWGGYEGAERARALICPEYMTPVKEDFGVNVVQVQAEPGGSLHHSALLGSLTGTGIDRRKAGDIAVISDHVAVVAVAGEILDYLLVHWRQAGRVPISLALLTEPVDWPVAVYEPQTVSVSSLRLDALVAAACKVSRARAQGTIESGQVSVNFVMVDHPDAALEEGDILSIRGFGRLKIGPVGGTSRKGRIHVEIGVMKS